MAIEIISNLLGVPGRVHSNQLTITEINGVTLVDAVTKLSWGIKRTGGDHVFALGKQKPIGQPVGNITPDDATITVHAHKLDAFVSAFGGAGAVGDASATITIKHLDKAPSVGVSPLDALRLAPVLIQLTGCTWQGFTESVEGGAAMVDITVKPNDVLPNGKSVVNE